MEKKKFICIIVVLFIVVVVFCVMVSQGETAEAFQSYESSYYVEASDNIFVRIAKISDDCCYYIVDMVLGGIESLFSSITGSEIGKI